VAIQGVWFFFYWIITSGRALLIMTEGGGVLVIRGRMLKRYIEKGKSAIIYASLLIYLGGYDE